MMMCSDLLRVGLVTIHIPVTEISHDLTRQKIVTRLEQLRSSLKADFGIVEPRIAVLALNPHAGAAGPARYRDAGRGHPEPLRRVQHDQDHPAPAA